MSRGGPWRLGCSARGTSAATRAPRRGTKRQRTRGDDAERALRADQQRGEVIAGVVLGQPGQTLDRVAVGEDHLQSGDPGAGGAVAQRPRTAGVAGHDPADRARVASGEVQPGVLAGAARGGLKRGQRGARTRGHLADREVWVADGVQAGEGQDDLAAARHPAPDEPRVTALGDDGCLFARAGLDDLRDLMGVFRAHDGARPSAEASGPVALVARRHVWLGKDVGGADDVSQGGLEGGHDRGRYPAHPAPGPSPADRAAMTGAGADQANATPRQRRGCPRARARDRSSTLAGTRDSGHALRARDDLHHGGDADEVRAGRQRRGRLGAAPARGHAGDARHRSRRRRAWPPESHRASDRRRGHRGRGVRSRARRADARLLSGGGRLRARARGRRLRLGRRRVEHRHRQGGQPRLHPPRGDHGLRQPAGRRGPTPARPAAPASGHSHHLGHRIRGHDGGRARPARAQGQDGHLAPLPAPHPGHRRPRAHAHAAAPR